MNTRLQTTVPSTEIGKQHFEVLDGLRGVAAIAVVVFHYMEFVYLDPSTNFIGHGFLAVDFFFCLSGFVIAYAYDNRMAQLGMAKFFNLRLIRLHPLVLLSAVLGMLAYFITWHTSQTPHDPLTIVLSFISSALLIPLPIMPERGFSLIAFNSPAWSLFFEYMANIFYALILYKISKRYLIVSTLLAAGALCYASFHAGNLIGGWDGKTFLDGCARVSFSFLAGLVIYRFQWILKTNIGFIGLSILLLFTFCLPFFSWNWLAEALVVIVVFPFLISLGAGTVASEKMKKACVWLGNISYPLYMTHYALIWFFFNYYTDNKPGTAELSLIIAFGTLMMIGFAYFILRVYDLPVRNFLTQRRKRNLQVNQKMK